VAIGQTATFTVDSFPGRTFSGQITQVRKAAQVIQNVVTYIAVIAAPNPDQTLLPGMSANVRIVTARRKDAVKIPNAALRYRPANAPASAKPEAKGGARGGENAKAAPAKGGNAQATRERLTKALGLSDEQQAKLESIQNDTREKISGIVADTPAARKREIGRLRAESRGRIAEMLTAEQRAKYEAIIAEQQGITARRGTVWMLDDQGNPKSVAVRLGISDGSYTELVGKELKAGDQVIVGAAGAGGARGGGATKGGPRFGF
jgi:HlyD family secretion protein